MFSTFTGNYFNDGFYYAISHFPRALSSYPDKPVPFYLGLENIDNLGSFKRRTIFCRV